MSVSNKELLDLLYRRRTNGIPMTDPHSGRSKKAGSPTHAKRIRPVIAAALAFVCFASLVLFPGCGYVSMLEAYNGASNNNPRPTQNSSSADPGGSGKTVMIGGEAVSEETIANAASECGVSTEEVIDTLERYASATSTVKEVLSAGDAVSDAERTTLEDSLDRMKQEGTIESWAFDEEAQYYLYKIAGGGFSAVPVEDSDIVGKAGSASPQAPQNDLAEQIKTLSQNTPLTSGERPRIHVLWSFNSDHSLYRFYGRTFWEELGAEVDFDDEVTLDDLRNLDKDDYDVTVFMCHGGNEGSIMPANLMIETAPTLEEIATFFAQCGMHASQSLSGTVQGLIPLPSKWLVTPNFFKHNYSADRPLHGAFMFYSCYFFGSSQRPNETFPQTFLDLGAEAVLGFRNSTWTYYGWHFIRTTVSHMLCGASIREGYEIAANTWGETGGDYLTGKDYEAYPILAGNDSFRLSRTVNADPADELNAELRRQKEVYREFLESTVYVTSELCPGGQFRIEGYAMEDISGDGIPELLLSTSRDGLGLDGILVCDVAMGEQVWPVYYHEADPLMPGVWLVNERWLRTDYHGTGGSGGSLYSCMHNLENVLYAHTEPDENGEGFGVRCFIDPGMETDFYKWETVGSILQREEPLHSVAVTRQDFEDYLRILPNTGSGEREIVFKPRTELPPVEDNGSISAEDAEEIYRQFLEIHNTVYTDLYPYGSNFDIGAYAREDLSGDGIPELILAATELNGYDQVITGVLVCTLNEYREIVPVFYMDTDVVYPTPSIADERWIVFSYHGTSGYVETYYRTITPDGVLEAKEVNYELDPYVYPYYAQDYYIQDSPCTKEQFENYLLSVSGEAVSGSRSIDFYFRDWS